MLDREAPPAWDGEDDFIITRESLDDAAPITFPAHRRVSSLPGAETDGALAAHRDASAVGEADLECSTPPVAPPASGVWESVLTPRQKVTRAASITLLIALTIYLLAGGPAATSAALSVVTASLNARLHPPAQQATLAQRGYAFVKSPPGAYNLARLSVAPASGQPDAAWVCWASPFAPHGPQDGWTAQAFYTATRGARWTRLTLPQSTAQDCAVHADSDTKGSALVVLNQGSAPDGSCIAPFMYLTTDTGASWTKVPWPIGPSGAACEFQTALEGGAIYVWSVEPLMREVNPYAPPTGRLIVSRDAGQTWALADFGLDDVSGFDIIGFRAGGHILASIVNVRGTAGSSTLMTSDDYGASWRSLGALPGVFPQVVVSTDPGVTDHGGWGRLYALSRTVVNDSPSVPPQYELASAYAGQSWAPMALPPLPSGASPVALSSQPVLLGVGPRGVLEVERGVVESRDAQLSASRRLWIWNPARRQWLLDPQIVPGNMELQGDVWSAGAQTFWMTTLQLGVPPVLQIYTKSYPSDLLRHVQWSSSVSG